ncbi:BK channel Interacting Protein [Caenorhabditis elegans]|uniref:BK channel Interacting Protein n=1 Tax=Caenorhabditis elegans TaxID=6239 RepID=D3NQA5_CAEEL|nr:BK channel Interacting Protein [Caenorhabditis elegans]CBK19496.1 BK channel Interacting Protein [Caenorhabditis elegans]|eukprot:NP_001254414.1 BK channel Interacting Protein [Caenorhabditis elegans]
MYITTSRVNKMQPGEILTWIMFCFTVALALGVVAYYKFCKKSILSLCSSSLSKAFDYEKLDNDFKIPSG